MRTTGSLFDGLITERTAVVISDNIQPRCMCPLLRGSTWTGWKDLHMTGKGRSRRARWMIVCECPRCGAAWEWGEVCAAEDPKRLVVPRKRRAQQQDHHVTGRLDA